MMRIGIHPWCLGLLAVAGCPAPSKPPATVAGGPASAAPREPEPLLEVATPRFELQSLATFAPGVHGMAMEDDGTVWFSDSFGNIAEPRRVYRLKPPYTDPPEPTPLVGKTPAGLLWTGGTVLVCDVGAGTVTRFDAALTSIESWQVPSPWNVSGPASGPWVSVTHDGKVFRLEPGGRATALYDGLLAPFDIVALADGTAWVSEQGANKGDPGRVARRGSDGSIATEADYPWQNPEGLAMAADGRLWVADTERGELVRVDAAGTAEPVATDLNLPVAVTATPSGNLALGTGGPHPQLWQVTFAARPDAR